jgi:hypothetical protein
MMVAPPLAALGQVLEIASAALGVIGLVVAGVFFAWHLRELKRTEAKTELNLAATKDVGRATLAALQLHEVIAGDEHLESVVQDLARHYVRLSKHKDSLATFLAGRELDEIARFMTMGAEGYITVGSDAFSHADRLGSALLRTTQSNDEFWASSLVAPEFWSHATAYLGQQAAKAASEVHIHRVFVFDSPAAFHDHRAQSQMALQAAEGIEVRYVIDPPYEMRDLVVVRKPAPAVTDKKRAARSMEAAYAMECRVGPDKRVDHIDLWTGYGLHSTRVDETWWNLDGIFKQSEPFALQEASPDADPATTISFPDRRIVDRRSGERRSGDRRIAERRAGDRRQGDVRT